jgi:hypothetical protein
MSGRSNIVWWLENRGIEASDDLVSHIFDVAKSQRRLMEDSELEAVIASFSS